MQILYILKNFMAAPETIVGTFQFYIVDICACLSKKNWVQKTWRNWGSFQEEFIWLEKKIP